MPCSQLLWDWESSREALLVALAPMFRGIVLGTEAPSVSHATDTTPRDLTKSSASDAIQTHQTPAPQGKAGALSIVPARAQSPAPLTNAITDSLYQQSHYEPAVWRIISDFLAARVAP